MDLLFHELAVVILTRTMKAFLYRLTATRPAMLTDGLTPAEQATVGRHFAYLEGLVQAGVLVLAGRTLTPTSFGIAIFHAPDEERARGIMEQDPAVQEGVMTAELFPFQVALLAGADR